MTDKVKIDGKKFKKENKIGFGTKLYRAFRDAKQRIVNMILIIITIGLFLVLPNSIYLIVFLFIFYFMIDYVMRKLISLKYLLRFDLVKGSFQLKQLSQSSLSEYKVLDETGTPCKFSYGLHAGKDEVFVYDSMDKDARVIKANPVFSDIELMVDTKNSLMAIKEKAIGFYRENVELKNLLAIRAVEEGFAMTMKNPLLDLLYHSEDKKEVKEVTINAEPNTNDG
jgi:hypothetical protein